MPYRSLYADNFSRMLSGFVAGFLATLVFHQLTLLILWGLNVAPFGPFSMTATSPFGIPAVVSLAFWGGIWGIFFTQTERSFPAKGGYWLAAFAFGAILPTVVALFIVLPLKGRPMGGGWHLPLMATAFLANGAWGVGTALFHKMLSRRFHRAHAARS
ncbi:MAG: hypothetical protein ABFD97_13370 [Syntrophobacter sp.]